MQTIKTAAVVVLMLTVLYGGYVSLTTPPEPLPSEIEEYLVIEESGDGAFAPTESLAADLPLDEPPPGVMLESATMLAQSPQTPTDIAPNSTALTAPPSGFGGANFADRSAAAAPDGAATSVISLPAGAPATAPATATAAVTKLPQVGTPGPGGIPGPAESYGSTANSYAAPTPDSAGGTFDPNRGLPFGSGAGHGTVAAASGTGATALDSLGPAPPSEAANRGLINAFATADAMYQKGQLKEALATLSLFYGMPNLSSVQREQLLSRLDPLAREVIYSRRHLLEQPHRVTASETLTEIASQYDVPWQLLANINQVDDPITVLPGTELKIIRGPFSADVDLKNNQMTMYLGNLYAGRFDIAVGSDPAPVPGTYKVQEKQTQHTFFDRTGRSYPPGNANNPYGNMWLDLGGQICIHGSPNTVQPTAMGCISVAGDYADDVYGILSQGSSVSIRR